MEPTVWTKWLNPMNINTKRKATVRFKIIAWLTLLALFFLTISIIIRYAPTSCIHEDIGLDFSNPHINIVKIMSKLNLIWSCLRSKKLMSKKGGRRKGWSLVYLTWSDFGIRQTQGVSPKPRFGQYINPSANLIYISSIAMHIYATTVCN